VPRLCDLQRFAFKPKPTKKLKAQESNGGALRRHYSLGLYVNFRQQA